MHGHADILHPYLLTRTLANAHVAPTSLHMHPHMRISHPHLFAYASTCAHALPTPTPTHASAYAHHAGLRERLQPVEEKRVHLSVPERGRVHQVRSYGNPPPHVALFLFLLPRCLGSGVRFGMYAEFFLVWLQQLYVLNASCTPRTRVVFMLGSRIVRCLPRLCVQCTHAQIHTLPRVYAQHTHTHARTQ